MKDNSDQKIKAQRVTLGTMTIDTNNKAAVRKRGVPKWMVVLFCAAVFAFIAISLYVFGLSGETGQAFAAASPSPEVTATPAPTPTPTPAPSPTLTPTPTPEPTPEPTPSTMWGANFPGKFTDGEIIQDENSYKSANVNVTVTKMEENGTVYFVADIYITDIKYFTAPFSSGKYNKGERKFIYKIAQDNDAIVAINGDFYTSNRGPVLRDGDLYRNEVKLDILVMFKDGTMKTYSKKEYDKAMIKSIKDDVWQIWTFGPMLLKDGEVMTKFDLPNPIGRANPRSAIGYYEPGHYVFVNVDGRQRGYSKGLSMKELSKLMYDLGCKVAFNLDGGGSAQIAFMGEEINQPCSTYRKDRDALCIIDGPAPGQ